MKILPLQLNEFTFLNTKTGRQRPISILTLRDRVIQQMLKNVLEPEWEALFEPVSYGLGQLDP